MRFATRPALHGTFGAVASTHWIGSAVGMRILELGGNAFDAAVAAGFALQIVEPHLNGPGGEVRILAARAGAAEPVVICGQGPAPRAATIDRFRALGLDRVPDTGHLAAVVPGAFGAWLALLRDHGTMRPAEMLEPAIFYAGGGHPLGWRVPAAILAAKRLFELDWRSSAAIYLPGGEVPRPGQIFRNLPLAMLYAAIVTDAARMSDREAQIARALDYWYRGPVAEAIGRFVRRPARDATGHAHAGFLEANDLAAWSPPIERPRRFDLDGLAVFDCGAWSQGPALLQLLQGRGVAEMDPTGPGFVHLHADRDTLCDDGAAVEVAALLCVADRQGNLVAAMPSGGSLQSSPVVPELGFGLSTRARMFRLQAGLASSLVPGTRPRTTLAPTLVNRDGAPWLAFGTRRGDQQELWSALLLHHAAQAMDLQEAIEATTALAIEDRLPRAMIDEPARRGHRVGVADGWSEGRFCACATETTADGRRLKAAADPRLEQGYALAR